MSKRKRLLGSNAQLNRSINAYVNAAEKLTKGEWNRVIRPMMRNVQNTIEQTLKSVDLYDWQINNLRRIQESIQVVINDFERQFAIATIGGQGQTANLAVDYTIAQAKLVALKSPAMALLGTELIETLTPLTLNMIKYWAADMAKVVGGVISNSIISRQTPGEAIIELRKKFGLTTEQLKSYEQKKVILDAKYKAGKISKTEYNKKIKPIRAKIKSGSIMSYARAEAIVRTEMMTAASMAQQRVGLAIAEINPEARKVWLWSHKPTGRIDHQKAEDEYKKKPIKVNENFIIGGESCAYPRDPMLSSKQRVHCGCTHAIVNGDDLTGIEGIGI